MTPVAIFRVWHHPVHAGTGRRPEPCLQRIAARDDAALAELYDRHSRLAFAIIRRIVQSPSDAEEVLQETFVRVGRGPTPTTPRLGSPAAWVVRIARNRAIDRLRARQARADVNAPVRGGRRGRGDRAADARDAGDADAERAAPAVRGRSRNCRRRSARSSKRRSSRATPTRSWPPGSAYRWER